MIRYMVVMMYVQSQHTSHQFMTGTMCSWDFHHQPVTSNTPSLVDADANMIRRREREASHNCHFPVSNNHLQVAQLSLTNTRDALHHDKRQNFKSHVTITMSLLLVICHHVARIDIAYMCTKFDDFRFSHSSDMIGAPKIFNGSHDLTTPLSETVCHPWAVTCTFNLYIKFGVFAITNYKDA